MTVEGIDATTGITWRLTEDDEHVRVERVGWLVVGDNTATSNAAADLCGVGVDRAAS